MTVGRGGSTRPSVEQGGLVVSVVIPTRDRRPILAATLEALERQRDLQGGFEVIVADDGSTDDTVEWVEARRARAPYPLRCLRLPPLGPAAARNRAIETARSPRVLLLGDDTLPEPATLAAHLEAGSGGAGVQGRIDWDPSVGVTPVMDFLAPEGPQFYFRGLVPGQPVPYTAVLGSNLSAPTAWFLDEPFDEGFPAAAFEDTELAYRWLRQGRRVIYWPRARCLHRHRYDGIEPFLRRQRLAGRAAAHGLRRHPRTAWRIAAVPAAVALLRTARYALRRLRGSASERDLWDLRSRAAFFSGLLLPRR